MEDIENRKFNRIWACADCASRQLHGAIIQIESV